MEAYQCWCNAGQEVEATGFERGGAVRSLARWHRAPSVVAAGFERGGAVRSPTWWRASSASAVAGVERDSGGARVLSHAAIALRDQTRRLTRFETDRHGGGGYIEKT